MKLFAFYIGGGIAGSPIEHHDVCFGIGEKIEDCYPQIRTAWWGLPETLHLDCWGELTAADGHIVSLKPAPPPEGTDKLWFVNLGGYAPASFGELHKNVFVVAPTESKGKVRALKTVLGWKSRHEDYQFEIENMVAVSDVISDQALHIHLEKAENIADFSFSYGFNENVRINK